MIRRNVGFSLNSDGGVLPSVPQYGGVKGEHNVTTLAFTMNTDGIYESGDLVRLGFCTGDGTVLSSDLLDSVVTDDSNHTSVRYLLPQTLTMAGGQLCVRLILSRLDENGREVEVFRSKEAVLYFDEAPVENGTPFWTGVSEMLHRTVTAKDACVDAQESAMKSAAEASAMADDARGYAQFTMGYAETARQSAESAAEEAQKVADEVQTATDAAQIAQTAASAAGACEENARGYANFAMRYAEMAGQSAQTAQESAITLQAYVDEKLTAVYRFKGSVATGVQLGNVVDPVIGDVYNVTADGMNYAYTGSGWDALGATITVRSTIAGNASDIGKPVDGYAVTQYVQNQMAALEARMTALEQAGA